jgi:tRNA-dependent cyclodipeptide synthase
MKHTSATKYAENGNLFIPISLGNHYYSSVVIRNLIDDFISPSKSSIVFLCDRLRFLSYLIRGEANLNRITSNIKVQVEQLTRALVKLGIQSCPHASIVDWSFCEDDIRYSRLLSNLQQLVRDDSTARRELNNHVTRSIAVHRKGADLLRSAELELEYITEETALSLYMTEIRDYNVEVYRRGTGFVDYLYAERLSDLLILTGKSVLNRKFISLELCDGTTASRRPITNH